MRIERAIGLGKHDISITEDHKAVGPITLVWRNIAENVLTSKLVQLDLVVIEDTWSYEPDGCLSRRKNIVKHELWSSWEGHTNPQVDDPNIYVGLNDFPMLKKTPWLSFYLVMQKYNPTKPIPQTMLEAMTLDSWPRKKRENFWIYQKEVSHLRAKIGNAPLDKHFELEQCEYNKSNEETGDSSPRGY